MANKACAKELSVQRPRHQVNLVEGTVEDGGPRVLCVAAEISKTFLIVKLVELWSRRSSTGKKSVILIEESQVQLIEDLLEGVRIQTSLSAKSFYSGCSRKGELLDCRNADIILISSACLFESLAHGDINLDDFSLVIVNSCHDVLDKKHFVARVMEKLTFHYQHSRQLKIVGITSELLAYQSCSEEMESFLSKLEAVFQCHADVSSDLLAMNRYGEQIVDECSSYSDKLPNDAVSLELAQILQMTLCFLEDCQPSEETKECITFITFLLRECLRVLQMFGTWACAHTAGVIARECAKFAKRYAATESEILLQFCRTQASLLHSQLKSLKGNEKHLTSLTGKLFGVFAELRLDDETPLKENTDCRHGIPESCSTSFPTETCEGKSSLDGEESLKSEDLNPNSDLQRCLTGETGDSCLDGSSLPKVHLLGEGTAQKTRAHCETKESVQSNHPQTPNNLPTKSKINKDPFCVVFVRSTVVARALSSLINALAAALPEYSFLRSQFLHWKKVAGEFICTQKSLDGQEGIMKNIQDGSLNVLVTTEQEIHVSRCSLVIQLDLPLVNYVHYQQIKQNARASGAKFFVFVPEEKEGESYRKIQELQQMEFILGQRCPGFHAPAAQVSSLFAGSALPVYKPHGKDGPMVDMLGSIALVNRYCDRFPNDGLNFAIPRLRTEERWSKEDVKCVSYLYLPRNSPIYWPIKGFAVVNKRDIDQETALAKARAQSQMSAALNACVELHERGALDSNLDPVGRGSTFEYLGEDSTSEYEVADGGAGMAGSMKRKRGYKRKIPSVFADNLPVAGEEVYVYSINMTLIKPGTQERAIRSQIIPGPSSLIYSLGILSRKPIPQLPDFSIYDRAGEMTVTVAALPNSLVLSDEQIAVVKRFHGYVFKHVINLAKTPGESVLSFDLESAVDGCLVVLLKNAEQVSSSQADGSRDGRVAFEFICELEKKLEDFEDPKDPPPVGLQDFEVFRHNILVSTYADQKSRYYVVDICYDRNPLDPFPSPETAATFKEYYDARYGVNISPNQPLLDVDHTSMRLNFLRPRYQNTKGQDLAIPDKDSKRTQKARVYLVPELCGVHPVPAYLWRRIVNLPSVLYRVESLLLAEELRSSIARETGVGSVEWPSSVPLPPLTAGELVGESFQVVAPAQDVKITKELGMEYVTGTSVVEDAQLITELETKKQLQEPGTPLAVETRLESFDAELDDSSDAFCETSPTPVAMGNHELEPCGQSTGHQDFGGSGMTAKLEHFPEGIPRKSCGVHSKTVCSAKEETLVKKLALATCDSGISLLPQASAALTAPADTKQVPSDLLEKVSRLTVANSDHLREESFALHSKAVDSAGAKCDSGVSLSPSSLQASGILTEGDTVQQAESVPANAGLFALHGPPCTLVLRALTCSCAGEMFSLERLEMYGDSFVKYVICSELFHKYPLDNEGKLSFLRGLLVSNRQLFYLGRRRDIPAHMFTRVFDPSSAWIPPGFCVDVAKSQQFSLMNLTPAQDTNEDDEDEEDTCFVNQAEEATRAPTSSLCMNSYLHHVVSDKAVADATEALVGAYLLYCGPEGAIRLLSWLGMEISFHKKEAQAISSQVEVGQPSAYSRETIPTQGALKHVERFDVDSLQPKFQAVEDSLKHVEHAGADSLQEEFQEVDQSLKYVEHPGGSSLEQDFQEIEYSLRHVDRADADSLQQEFQEVDKSLKYVEQPGSSSLEQDFQEIEGSLRHVDRADVDSLRQDPGSSSLEQDFQEIEGSLRHVDRADADSLRQEFQEVEKSLNYVFTDKSLLLQAFTHSSYPREYNAVKSSYEQLEFLGDALMDFLLTRHLYFHQRDRDPGAMTDLRSALVNNYNFATLAVRCGFHRHLRSMSPPLFKIVNEFVEAEHEKKASNPDQVFSTVFTLPSVNDEDSVGVEVPKVLGDLFEAVVGAVYVDSGLDPEAVWHVFYPFLKPSIDYYSVFLPMSPIRQLLEMKTKAVHFSPSEHTMDGKYKCTLIVDGLGKFVGLGRSSRIAKSTAAQQALKRLQAQGDSK